MPALSLLPCVLAMVTGGQWTTRTWLETTVGRIVPTGTSKSRANVPAPSPHAPELPTAASMQQNAESSQQETGPVELTPSRRLSKRDVMRLLNTIPTFNLVDDTEQIVSSLDASGEESICCYLDPIEALSSLVVLHNGTIASPADVQSNVHLAVGPDLGTALALSEGWATTPSNLPVRIQASRPIIERMKEHLVASGEADCFVVPLFTSEPFNELTSPRVTLFFLTPRDFAAAWISTGLPPDKIPPELTLAPLRTLVNLMLSGEESRDWRNSRFVASEQSALVALVCEKEAEMRAKRRTASQMARAAGLAEEEEDDDPEDPMADDPRDSPPLV